MNLTISLTTHHAFINYLCISAEYIDVFQGLPVIKWHEIVEDDIEEEALKVKIIQ